MMPLLNHPQIFACLGMVVGRPPATVSQAMIPAIVKTQVSSVLGCLSFAVPFGLFSAPSYI
jgi:hypothetical protein